MSENIERQEQGLGVAVVSRSGEMAVSALAAQAKALVEARFVIALNRPRKIMDARAKILDACKRPRFAETARYHKKVGSKKDPKTGRWEDCYADGPSIRFAETAIQAMTNIDVSTQTIWEDDDKKTVRISVIDFETNTAYSKDETLSKTVERSKLKDGQSAVSERLNSEGKKVYIVAATEDEMRNKIASAESKTIRNSGLRLVPQDIVEEAMDEVLKTLETGGEDPRAAIKKIADAFHGIGVNPSDLEFFLQHSLDSVTPKEVNELRGMYTAIKDGEANWQEYVKDIVKRPAQDPVEKAVTGTDATVTAPATTPQTQPADTSTPIDRLLNLIKESDVTQPQVMGYCKKIKLAKETQVELNQLADSKLINLANTWTTILPEIRNVKA